MKSFNKIASNLHKMQRRKKPQKLLSLARCSPLNNNTIAIVQKKENCSQTMENFGSSSGNNNKFTKLATKAK